MDERDLTTAEFPVLRPMTTRWADNDMFGHLNNAVYYQLFDTAINAWLSEETGIPPTQMPGLALVVESGCKYFREAAFPQPVTIGLRTLRIGNSSVTYQLGLFAGEGPAAAVGTWTHVYVDTQTRRPVSIPAVLRTVMETASTP